MAGRRDGAVWAIATLLAVGFAALAGAFQTPQAPSTVLDASYQVVLGQAASRGFVAGRDLVFTYGPLAWLVFPIQTPVTYGAFVIGTLAFAIVFASLYVALARRSAWPAWLALVPFAVLVLAMSLPERRIYAFAVLLVAYLYDGRAPRSALLVGAATVLLGVLALAKFTLFALALGLYGVLAVADLLRGRLEGALWLLVLVIVWPLAWLATYGSLEGYLAFLATSAEVARGHAASQALWGPREEVVLFLGLALPSLVLAVVPSRRTTGAALAHLASLGALWLVVFKHAFVRHDVHALMAWSTLVALNVVSLVALTPRDAFRRVAAASVLGARLVLCGASLACLWSWSAVPNRRPLSWDVTHTLDELPGSVRRAGRFLTGEEPGGFRASWDDAMAAIRAAHPLPPFAGSVDFFGSEQTLAIAHGLDWRPRPVFQDYLAYTGPLLALNADFLERRGADTLLFTLHPIDGRLPATVEGLSWPVLLTHYVPSDRIGEYLRLDRRAPPGRVEREPLGSVEVRFGERIPVPPVPPGWLVWARVEVEPSLLGRLVEAVWKPPLVFVDYELTDGTSGSARLVPEITAAGFVLSPIVRSTDDFAVLARALPDGPIPLPRVTALRIASERPQRLGPVSVVFERMRITPPHSRPAAAGAPATPDADGQGPDTPEQAPLPSAARGPD